MVKKITKPPEPDLGELSKGTFGDEMTAKYQVPSYLWKYWKDELSLTWKEFESACGEREGGVGINVALVEWAEDKITWDEVLEEFEEELNVNINCSDGC